MKAALLLVDVQRDFLSRPGLVPDARELERRLAGLIAAFRRNRLPVLHSRTLIGSDGRGRMPHWVRLGRL
ncbi:MAG: isochorismatase family protein, partial [Candidatus Methylophosphatis roskildensis]